VAFREHEQGAIVRALLLVGLAPLASRTPRVRVAELFKPGPSGIGGAGGFSQAGAQSSVDGEVDSLEEVCECRCLARSLKSGDRVWTASTPAATPLPADVYKYSDGGQSLRLWLLSIVSRGPLSNSFINDNKPTPLDNLTSRLLMESGAAWLDTTGSERGHEKHDGNFNGSNARGRYYNVDLAAPKKKKKPRMSLDMKTRQSTRVPMPGGSSQLVCARRTYTLGVVGSTTLLEGKMQWRGAPSSRPEF